MGCGWRRHCCRRGSSHSLVPPRAVNEWCELWVELSRRSVRSPFSLILSSLTCASFQFVGNLWNEEAMNARLNSLVKATETRGITFRTSVLAFRTNIRLTVHIASTHTCRKRKAKVDPEPSLSYQVKTPPQYPGSSLPRTHWQATRYRHTVACFRARPTMVTMSWEREPYISSQNLSMRYWRMKGR